MITLNCVKLNGKKESEELLKPQDRLTQVKRQLCNLATYLHTDKYLRYKREINQCRSLGNLEVIGVNLVKEVCG